MNATVTRLGQPSTFAPFGPPAATSVFPVSPLTVVFADGTQSKIARGIAACIVTNTGNITTSTDINRLSDVWLLFCIKGQNQLLTIQEKYTPTFDFILGGDGNYGILARVLHRNIDTFQNV